jgi:hypothetical protein
LLFYFLALRGNLLGDGTSVAKFVCFVRVWRDWQLREVREVGEERRGRLVRRGEGEVLWFGGGDGEGEHGAGGDEMGGVSGRHLGAGVGGERLHVCILLAVAQVSAALQPAAAEQLGGGEGHRRERRPPRGPPRVAISTM